VRVTGRAGRALAGRDVIERPGMQRAEFSYPASRADASRAAVQACARQRPSKLVDGYFVRRACEQ